MVDFRGWLLLASATPSLPSDLAECCPVSGGSLAARLLALPKLDRGGDDVRQVDNAESGSPLCGTPYLPLVTFAKEKGANRRAKRAKAANAHCKCST